MAIFRAKPVQFPTNSWLSPFAEFENWIKLLVPPGQRKDEFFSEKKHETLGNIKTAKDTRTSFVHHELDQLKLLYTLYLNTAKQKHSKYHGSRHNFW